LPRKGASCGPLPRPGSPGRLVQSWARAGTAALKALMAEDRQGDGHTPAGLREARWDFISRALEAGWTLEQASLVLGVKIPDAAQILEKK